MGRRAAACACAALLACLALGAAWGATKDLSLDGPDAAVLGRVAASLGPAASGAGRALEWLGWTSPGRWAPGEPDRNRELFLQDVEFVNGLVTWAIPAGLRDALPRPVKTWFRNWMFGNMLYLVLDSAWVYYIYYVFGGQLFGQGEIPSVGDVLEQVRVALWAMPGYSLLPTFTDFAIEWGWTRAFPRVADVGLGAYAALFVVYMAGVEFGVYWMHRGLHEIQWAYRLLHNDHHKYNKPHTLSPFAGLAFHPLDGVLQALPYSLMLFVVPFHYLTHLMLLFLTGVWTTNIHDCLDGRVEPIMGAGYHTIHHTTYKDNYGHYFIYMDWMFGTLKTPEEHMAQMKGEKQS